MRNLGRMLLGIAGIRTPPPADMLELRATKEAGFILPAWAGPDGVEYDLSPSYWGDVDLLYIQGGGINALGVGYSLQGTQSYTNPASTNYRASVSRSTSTSATTAGSNAGARRANPTRWRGDAAGMGGFYVVFRFGLTVAAGHQVMVGMGPATTIAGEPSAVLNTICIGADSTDTNLQIMVNSGTGAAVKTALNVAKTSTDMFRLTMYCPPNGSTVYVQLYNESTQAVVTDTALSTRLPANTTFLAETAYVRNGSTTTAAVIDLVRILSVAPTR